MRGARASERTVCLSGSPARCFRGRSDTIYEPGVCATKRRNYGRPVLCADSDNDCASCACSVAQPAFRRGARSPHTGCSRLLAEPAPPHLVGFGPSRTRAECGPRRNRPRFGRTRPIRSTPATSVDIMLNLTPDLGVGRIWTNFAAPIRPATRPALGRIWAELGELACEPCRIRGRRDGADSGGPRLRHKGWSEVERPKRYALFLRPTSAPPVGVCVGPALGGSTTGRTRVSSENGPGSPKGVCVCVCPTIAGSGATELGFRPEWLP